MDLPRLPTTRGGQAALLLGFWGAFGLALAAHALLMYSIFGTPWRADFPASGFLVGFLWAGLTPLVVRLARRAPPVGRGWVPRLGLHLVVSLGLNVAASATAVAAVTLLGISQLPLSVAFLIRLSYSFIFFEIVYAGVVVAVLAYDALKAAEAAREEAREREVRAAHLEAQLVHARLDALRSQLNPHFLFNTLHAVSTLMARDVAAARTVLADLAALLRLALDRFGEPEVPLDDELDFLGHYLDIERTRFEDRLTVVYHVDEDVRDALVPPLVLQPLIENALKHAVTSRPDGGRVEVSARHDAAGDALVLTVTDDGPGMPAQMPERVGIGIKTTRDRLGTLYGPLGLLGFRTAPGGGVEAEVRLPFHTSTLHAPTS